MKPWRLGARALWLAGALGAVSCGRDDLLPGEGAIDTGISVVGTAGLGTQCPHGSIQDPAPRALQLWDCPVPMKEAEFLTPPKPVALSVDCAKNIMTVRSPDRSIDFLVEIRPNHTFSAVGEGGPAVIQSDGRPETECTAYMQLDLRGSVECQDRDKVQINLDAFWWPALGSRPPSVTGRPGRDCKLPPSCYFHTSAKLEQCR